MVVFILVILLFAGLITYFLLPKREKIGEKILRPYEEKEEEAQEENKGEIK